MKQVKIPVGILAKAYADADDEQKGFINMLFRDTTPDGYVVRGEDTINRALAELRVCDKWSKIFTALINREDYQIKSEYSLCAEAARSFTFSLGMPPLSIQILDASAKTKDEVGKGIVFLRERCDYEVRDTEHSVIIIPKIKR